MNDIITSRQDLTYLNWSHLRSSSGTAGTFLKATSEIDGIKTYYKLSNFDPVKGVTGHECVNEIIVARLMELLGINHLSYKLINAEIEINHQCYTTYLCESHDFKLPGESKSALDDYYRINSFPGETPYDFCTRMGWQDVINQMIALDYIILNRDRHGANIEILRNSRKHTLRIAPLFDHGLSLLFSCRDDSSINAFDIMSDLPCNAFIGTSSCKENLSLIKNKAGVFQRRLLPTDKDYLLEGISEIMSSGFVTKIWDMIYERYNHYEKL